MANIGPAAPLWRSLLLTASLWAIGEAKPSIPMDYCASINTASMAANHSIYQSDGLCFRFCKPDFALAIVQDDSCWCSNFVPDKQVQVSTSQCSKSCPGYPDDVCGGPGLFGYMLLQQLPSGTIAVGQTSTPSTSSTTDGNNDRPATASQTPSISYVTVGGTISTVTYTPAPTGASSQTNSAPITTPGAETSSGLSPGAAAGIAVAVVAAFLIIGGTSAWLWFKRRRARPAEEGAVNFSPRRGSSAGMTATPRTGEVSETRYYMGSETAAESSRRRSTLMPVDPRLDPYAKGIYARDENKSHDSINTIRDDHDYSRKIQEPPRVLRATNPDPDFD